jgi:multidrug efflux system membrane fusion protein
MTNLLHRLLIPGAAALVLTLSACSPAPQPPAAIIRPVRTIVVAAGEDASTRIFPGRVEAAKQVELTFQVPGLLANLPVREGQKVAEGDLIAQLRPDEFQARLDALQGQLAGARADLQGLQAGARPEERLRLEAQLRSAEATLANARTDLDRATQLLNSQTISRLEFDTAQTSYQVAVENREAARQTLEQGLTGREEDILAKASEVSGLEARVVEAGIALADTTLRAPYAGVIARRFVEQGQSIRAKQPVVKFQDVEEIDIAVDVPESIMASAVRTADITNLSASFSAVPGLAFPVHLREIAQRADPTTQTFNVRVAMQKPPGINLLPGMTATVSMTYQRAAVLGPRIFVPVAAVSRDSAGETAVWIVGPDNTVSRRPVRTGGLTGGRIEILEGLQPGDRVAAAGVNHLRAGMQVRELGDALGAGRP